jgi:hypothetical protein
MILAWVISLLLICSSLITHLERWSALKIMHVNTIKTTQAQFIKSEQSVIECEKHILNLLNHSEKDCNIQAVGKNIWKVSSIEKPVIQVHVHVDEISGLVTRINWRQAFE